MKIDFISTNRDAEWEKERTFAYKLGTTDEFQQSLLF